MKKHKFKIVLFIVVAVLVYVFYYTSSNYSGDTVSINGHVFKVDVVNTQAEIKKGLSGKESMNNDQAMLFVFNDYQKHTFWMKEMNFDIDLLWIADNKIIAYEKNMLAPDKDMALEDLPSYNSGKEVDKALEIKAGLIDSLDIKIGDTININI